MTTNARVRLFVGSYSEPVPHSPSAHGAGLSVIDLDLHAGTAETRLEYGGVVNPSYVCVSHDRRIVYLTSERYGVDGSVSAVEFDDDVRGVRARTDLATGGTVASYVSLASAGRLLVSNYGDGSLASFALAPDGHLDARTSLVALSGDGPDRERQQGPHAHCILEQPLTGRVYAADLGADTLTELALGPGDGVLSIVRQTSTSPGAGPRHVAFGPGGTTAFVVNELTSRLAVYRVAAQGQLQLVDDLSMLPTDFDGSSFGADVVVTATGRVFASNRGHDSVVSVDRGPSGSYEVTAWWPTGSIPRGLALTPDERYLLVANQESDEVQLFELIDDGSLMLRSTIAVATPVCVKCVTLGAGTT